MAPCFLIDVLKLWTRARGLVFAIVCAPNGYTLADDAWSVRPASAILIQPVLDEAEITRRDEVDGGSEPADIRDTLTPSRPLSQASQGTPRRSAAWLAAIAASRSSLAGLMRSDLQADEASVRRPTERQRAAMELRHRAQGFRIARQSQIVASQALEIHFALTTIEQASDLQSETREQLMTFKMQQDQASAYGLPSLDPMSVDRLLLAVRDKEIELQSKATQLRSQLAILVGTDVACGYRPELPDAPPCPPLAIDACALIEQAYQQRCDLLGLVYLRHRLTADTIDVARWISDVLSTSVPTPALSASRAAGSLLGNLLVSHHQNDEAELCTRLMMLDQAIAALRHKIAADVDVAVEKQRAAAERYCNALEQIRSWELRWEQLRRYGDQVKPLVDQELEARQEWFRCRGDAIQRQGEWLQAIVELNLAIGSGP